MCGIAGMFEYRERKPVDQHLLRQMTDVLMHRGPDGSGFHVSRDCSLGLGHRRLSIIDLQTGDQPITNEDGTVWITFNGEVYNYKDLREELRSKGHIFKTASDTEVIVHAYEEWGVECPVRLNGIFAFAIWDEKTHSLFLARDHFGVKPLYYHDDGKRFLFASEMKAILSDAHVPRGIDQEALHFLLAFRHTPAPWTLFQEIRKLAPSSFIVVSPQGVRGGKYWNSVPVIDRRKREAEWIEELSAVYPEAVHRQMVSDVPIGLSLSGGVDSNTLLALMSQRSTHVHTFTVGFEGGNTRDNEIDAAVHSAKAFDADFETRLVTEEDYIQFMDDYLWHLEEPIGNESAAAYHFVAKLAKPKVKVLLSGQGADEPFAGYGRHLAAQYAGYWDWIPGGALRPAGRLLQFLLRGSESPGRFAEALSQEDEVDGFFSVYSISTPTVRRQLFGQNHLGTEEADLVRSYVRSQLNQAPKGSMLERMTFVDARTSLSDNLLLCGDKMAMAASVEMRVPFLDLKVMDVAERIPGKMKVSWLRNKVIHKKVCEKWLPREVVRRRKVGFNEVMGKWMMKRLERLLAELIDSPDSVTRTLLNPDVVRRLQVEHKHRIADHQRILFLLLSIETWNKVFR